MVRSARWSLLVVLFWPLAFAGCGDDEALKSPTALRMSGLANMYLDHLASKGPPADEKALKSHMRGQMDFQLRSYHIDSKNIDAAFKSDRDNEQLVVIYGVGASTISGDSKQVVAHEKTGVNGKLLVAFLSTKVALVSQAELEQLKSAPPEDAAKAEKK